MPPPPFMFPLLHALRSVACHVLALLLRLSISPSYHLSIFRSSVSVSRSPWHRLSISPSYHLPVLRPSVSVPPSLRIRSSGSVSVAEAWEFPPHSQPSFPKPLTINDLQKQEWIWVLPKVPKSRAPFRNLLTTKGSIKEMLAMGWKTWPFA